jgi:hypothetical protein
MQYGFSAVGRPLIATQLSNAVVGILTNNINHQKVSQ